MKIAEPKTYFLPNLNGNISHVAECASICYNSTPTNATDMYNKLIARRHMSMLRHATHYFCVPTNKLGAYYQQYFRANPYCGIVKENKFFFIVLNGQFFHENVELIKKSGILDYPSEEVAFYYNRETIRLLRLTFIVDTQIAITRELNRVSPNNIAERSTRFIDFLRKLGIRFSAPHWLGSLNLYRRVLAKVLLRIASASYRIARSKYGINLRPEDARYFLPLGTESRVAYTYTIAEWLEIVEKRYHDTTGKAHPDCKIAVKPIHDKIHEILSQYDA